MPGKTQEIIFELKAVNTASSAFRQVEGDLGRLEKYGGKAGAQAFDLKPIRASVGFDDQEIRDNVAKALRIARAEAQERRNQIKLLPFDPADEAREQFKATGAGRSGPDAKNMENFTDKAVKAALVLQGIKAGIKAIDGGVSLWHAHQAEIAGDMAKASAEYLNFADTIKSIPIAGGIAFDAANFLSGGAVEAAKKASADALANDTKSAGMKDARGKAKAAMEAIAKRRQLDLLPEPDRLHGIEKLQHEENLANIKAEQDARHISVEQAKAAMAVENAAWMKFQNDEEADRRSRVDAAIAENTASQLEAADKLDEAERVRFKDQLREKEVLAAKAGEQELSRQQALNVSALAAFEARMKREAEDKAKQASERVDKALDDFFKPIEDFAERGVKIDEALEDFFWPIEAGKKNGKKDKSSTTQFATLDKSRFVTGSVSAFSSSDRRQSGSFATGSSSINSDSAKPNAKVEAKLTEQLREEAKQTRLLESVLRELVAQRVTPSQGTAVT